MGIVGVASVCLIDRISVRADFHGKSREYLLALREELRKEAVIKFKEQLCLRAFSLRDPDLGVIAERLSVKSADLLKRIMRLQIILVAAPGCHAEAERSCQLAVHICGVIPEILPCDKAALEISVIRYTTVDRLAVIKPHLPVIAPVLYDPGIAVRKRCISRIIPAVSNPQSYHESVIIRTLHDLVEFGECRLIVHVPHVSRLELAPRDNQDDAVEAVRLDPGKVHFHVVIFRSPEVDRPCVSEICHGFQIFRKCCLRFHPHRRCSRHQACGSSQDRCRFHKFAYVHLIHLFSRFSGFPGLTAVYFLLCAGMNVRVR